jgi:SRSO17 transposase
MTPFILNRWPRFSNYVALFNGKMNKAARDHLLHLLIGFLIYLGPKNLTGLNRATFNRRHLSSVDRFITEASWKADELEQIRQEDLTRRVRRYLEKHRAKGKKVPIFLCLDDTNNPKSGEKTEWVSYQYSHLAGGVIRCFCLVTAVVVVGPWVIPYDFKLYRRKQDCEAKNQPSLFRKKTALAAELIEQWQPFEGTEPYVLLDSWYTGEEVLAACAKRHFTLIGGVIGNRSFRTTAKGAYSSIQEQGTKLAASAYHLVTVGKQHWQMSSLVADLKWGYKVKLIFSKAPYSKKIHYFVCSNQALSVGEIMEYYSVRWEIETFHKQAKQLLGLCDNQCLLERNVRRLWTLLLIAYSYLMIERVEHADDYPHYKEKGLPSLGQVQRQHQLWSHQGQVEWAYQAGKSGLPLETILEAIKA